MSDTQAFKDSKAYVDSDFAQSDPPGTMSTPDLQNGIKGLFDRQMFHTLTDDEWTSLEVPLKLASRMLCSTPAVRYITTMSDGILREVYPRTAINPNESFGPAIQAGGLPGTFALAGNSRLVRSPRSATITQEMRERSQEILRDLMGVLLGIEVMPSTIDEDDRTGPSQTDVPEAALRKFPRCPRMIKIQMNHKTVWRFQVYLGPENAAYALAYQFRLATNLVHEVAHLLAYAVHGDRSEDVFYDDNICNETGFDLETAIVGGPSVIDTSIRDIVGHPDPNDVAMTLHAYPSGPWVKVYAASGQTLATRGPALDFYSVYTRLPWRFIGEMFTERFWVHDVPPMGLGPIKPIADYSWVMREVYAGETYINAAGTSVTVTEDTTVACRLADPSLPPWVQAKLVAITNAQIARRNTPQVSAT